MTETGGNRYVVRSLSGYPIDPSRSHYMAAEDGRKWGTEWYVLDSCDTYNIVARFMHKNAEENARKRARELNQDERRWEVAERVPMEERLNGRPA